MNDIWVITLQIAGMAFVISVLMALLISLLRLVIQKMVRPENTDIAGRKE